MLTRRQVLFAGAATALSVPSGAAFFGIGNGVGSPKWVARTLGTAQAFLKQSPGGFQTFDVQRAAAVLSPEMTDFVNSVIRLSNYRVEHLAVMVDVDIERRTQSMLRGFYRAFTRGDSEVLASLSEGHTVGAAAAPSESSKGPGLASHCSGPQSSPIFCPIASNQWGGWMNRQEVIDYLLSQGYHKTPGYACGDSPDDYSKWIPPPYSYNGCDKWGAFREQAIVWYDPTCNCYAFRDQYPEPNPEVLSYIWPEGWWEDYVHWWHFEYC